MGNEHSVKRALISTYDKKDLLSLCGSLLQQRVEIVATGGTYNYLKMQGIEVTPIEELTHFPECFDGRVKTINPYIAGGILFRRNSKEDIEQLDALKMSGIDLVVCNLYPFEKASREQLPDHELVEYIDIGGVTLIRAAAKNHQWVTVLTDPSQYDEWEKEFTQTGVVSYETRRKLAIEAFRLTAHYDLMIAESFAPQSDLRYGENPHQKAHLIPNPFASAITKEMGLFPATSLQGKALSYNNYLDAETAYCVARDLFHQRGDQIPAVAIVKHANPCGVAQGHDPLQTLNLAFESDPISAYGGILCTTSTIDITMADFLRNKFLEVIMASDFTQEALSLLGHKSNLRLIKVEFEKERVHHLPIKNYRSLVGGGLLIQDEDFSIDEEWQSVTATPFPVHLNKLTHFGLVIVKYLKSNAIALVQNHNGVMQLMGAGMGQPNRIDSLKLLALPRAKAKIHADFSQMVLVSDAFFPFPDAIHEANSWGIQYVVSPSGSIRDSEVVSAANSHGMAMAFTNKRHFRH